MSEVVLRAGSSTVRVKTAASEGSAEKIEPRRMRLSLISLMLKNFLAEYFPMTVRVPMALKPPCIWVDPRPSSIRAESVVGTVASSDRSMLIPSDPVSEESEPVIVQEIRAPTTT